MGFRANVVNTFLTKIFLLIFGLGSSIVYARVLGAHAFGQGVLLVLFPPIFVKLINLGVAGSVTYFVGQNPKDKQGYIGTSLSFSFVVGFVALVTLLSLEQYLFESYYKSDVPRDLLQLVFWATPLSAFKLYLRTAVIALNRIKEFNFFSETAPTILRFSAVVILIGILELGVAAYVMLDIVINIIICLSFAWVLHKDGVLVLRFDIAKFKLMLHYGIRGYFTNMSAALSSKIDQLIIGMFLSPAAAGIYSIAESLAAKILIVARSIQRPLLPQLSRLSKAEATAFANKILDQILLPVAFTVLVAIVASPFAIPIIYGEKFAQAWEAFFFLALAAQFISLNKIVSAYFVATGRPGIKSIQRGAVLAIRSALLVALVPIYQTVACGISTFVAEALVYACIFYYYKRVENLRGVHIFSFSADRLVHELRKISHNVLGRPKKVTTDDSA
jgi:O-antigen/teichoic acid export membrane protein